MFAGCVLLVLYVCHSKIEKLCVWLCIIHCFIQMYHSDVLCCQMYYVVSVIIHMYHVCICWWGVGLLLSNLNWTVSTVWVGMYCSCWCVSYLLVMLMCKMWVWVAAGTVGCNALVYSEVGWEWMWGYSRSMLPWMSVEVLEVVAALEWWWYSCVDSRWW